MVSSQLMKQTEALRAAMAKAIELADELYKNVPAKDEPAVSAQANVIRAFLHQTDQQERLLTRMITEKQQG